MTDDAINEKLLNLPFTKVQHQSSNIDAQSSKDGAIIVAVTGVMLVDEEERPLNYVQTFFLYPEGDGVYFISNDIIRLAYS